MCALPEKIVKNDCYSDLKQFTDARIAIGRAGYSVPLREMLEFKMSHAHARDEVFSELNIEELSKGLHAMQLIWILVKSRAANRELYIRRPDLGRKLSDESVGRLSDLDCKACDVAIILADGLSASAINNHAIPFLSKLIPALKLMDFSLAAVVITENGRVAIGDEIAFSQKARMSLILIGERPGLSSPDSMGAYLTYSPKPGLKDDSRNCVSNIRQGGLDYPLAADKVCYLIKEAFARKLSGVALKEEFVCLPGYKKEDDQKDLSS